MRRVSGAVTGMFIAFAASAASPMLRDIGAQRSPPAEASSRWTVTRDPFVDLWFHSLALVGYDGFGPLDLYDRAYATRVRGEKERAHITTTLDRRAAELRTQLAADSAFEILHFVPLYFAGQEPERVLDALRAATRGNAQAQRGGSLASAASAVLDALPSPRERAIFLSLLDAVGNEWSSFLRADRLSHDTEERRATRDLQTAWDEHFAPVLGDYLAATGARRGTILVSPAVGSEGRVLHGPNGAAIVVVSSKFSAVDQAPLLAAIRELAFPLLDQLHAPPSVAASRVAAARARDAAAVRAGSLVLDAADPSLAVGYRRLFVEAAGGRAFETAYPLDSAVQVELRHLVTSVVHGAVSPGRSYENY